MKSLKKIHELAATYLHTKPEIFYCDEGFSQFTCDCLMYATENMQHGYLIEIYIKELWKEYGMPDFGYVTFNRIPKYRRQEARFDWLMLMANVLKDEKL